MRNVFPVLLLFLARGMAFANTINEIPFVSMSPEVLGRGGSVVADARGYDSLFSNPAGFSRDPSTFTLVSAGSWVYARPDQFLGLVAGGGGSPTSIQTFFDNQLTRGGVGAGASWGIGYVGGGLGLGACIILDSLLTGPDYLDATGDLTGTIGFIGGLAVPFEVAGFKVHVGGDIRPMLRIHSPLTNSEAVGLLNALADGKNALAALGTADAVYGVGIGLDVGAIAELGVFNVGVSIRDIGGTQFRYYQSTLGTVESSLSSSLQFPSNSSLVTQDQYVIPMDIAVGVSFHPDFGTFNNTVDPTVSFDMSNIAGGLAGQVSPWTFVHLGIETRFFSVFTLRTGLNQGYLTLGGGIRLFVLDVNFALFTRELGDQVGDQPLTGMTLDASVRW